MIGTGSPTETFRRADDRQSGPTARVSRNEWQSSDPAWLLSEVEHESEKASASKRRPWLAVVRAAASKLASMLF